MAWICWGLIQQRREPPMATSRALVMVPLWSRNFCRMAWGQCWGQWDWDCWHQGPQVPPPSSLTTFPHPSCPHLRLVLQGHVRGQQGHDGVPRRDVPLADLHERVQVDQRGDELKLLFRDATGVDLRQASRSGPPLAPTAHLPPPGLQCTRANLALTTR